MHPNEVDGRIKALSALRALFGDRGSLDDDDRDAGVKVCREPRSPSNAGGIAVPEPDDGQSLDLVDTERHRNRPIPHATR